MIKFQWIREGELISISPHLSFAINDEGEGYRFHQFYEGGYESTYSLDFDHLVKLIEKKMGATNLMDFKDELIRQYITRLV